MALVTGFFTRSELKTKNVIRKDQGLSVERLRELGIKGVDRMNPRARTKHMKPTGSKRPDVYVLGETPNDEEDDSGVPFDSKNGDHLKLFIPDGARVRFDNCVRTLPIRRKGILKPTTHEIECYRSLVEKSIVEAKPKIILALGDTAIQWCLGNEAGEISVCRGRRFPTEIGGHRVWVYAAHHPHYILRQLDNEDYAQISGEEHAKYFQKDVERAFDDLNSLPIPSVEKIKDLYLGTRIELKDVGKIEEFLLRACKEPVVSIDVETNRLRPYAAGAKLLTLAVGTSFGTLSFPIDHPGSTFSTSDKKRVDTAVRKFLKHKVKKIAHNTTFDLEWLVWKYGLDCAFACFWHDTMDQAYHLDERQGGMSLNFLNILYFGLKLKKQSVGRTETAWFGMGSETTGEIDRAKLEFTHVEDVCKYNGLDSKYTLKLYHVQKRLLKERGLWEPYREHVRRVPSCVTAQRHGLPIDQKTVIEFQKKEGEAITALEKQIKTIPVIIDFEKKFGPYKDSNKNNKIVFADMLRMKEVWRGNRISTDESVLSKIKHPLADLLLEIRGHKKLKGTYIDRFHVDHKDSFIFPSGKIHCSFNHTKTDTKRMSASNPASQNWPKRENKWIRGQVTALPGYTMLCCDQGQLEFRVIGMASKDKVICDSLFNDYDVHMVWAEKIAKVYPKVVRDRHGSLSEKAIKLFRGELKTDVIFPWLYGATLNLACNALDHMPKVKLAPIYEEFSDTFKGAFKYQRVQQRFYEEHGYTEALTGHRRHGPMSKNQLINSGIQGTASDIVCWSWNELNRIAYETDRPWLAPALNVHDDLSFFVPTKKVDEALEAIIPAMCLVPYEFINVPLVVEASTGPNWADQKEIGKFRSDKLDDQLEAYLTKAA